MSWRWLANPGVRIVAATLAPETAQDGREFGGKTKSAARRRRFCKLA